MSEEQSGNEGHIRDFLSEYPSNLVRRELRGEIIKSRPPQPPENATEQPRKPVVLITHEAVRRPY
jgi:hypothetical protein